MQKFQKKYKKISSPGSQANYSKGRTYHRHSTYQYAEARIELVKTADTMFHVVSNQFLLNWLFS